MLFMALGTSLKSPKNQSRGQNPSTYAYCKRWPSVCWHTTKCGFFCSRQTRITVSGVHNVMAQRVGIFGNGTALHNLQFSLPLFHTHTHTHSHAHTYFKQGGRKEQVLPRSNYCSFNSVNLQHISFSSSHKVKK